MVLRPAEVCVVAGELETDVLTLMEQHACSSWHERIFVLFFVPCELKQKRVSCSCVHACCKLIPCVRADACAALIVRVCELKER